MIKRYKLLDLAPEELKTYIYENTGDIKTGFSNFLAQLDMSVVSKYDKRIVT